MRPLLPRCLLYLPLLLLACSPDGQDTAAAAPPRIDYASIPWVQLHPASLRGTAENRIFYQYPEAKRPIRIAGKDSTFSAADHRLWPGTWIVEVVIAKDGRIARFRILRGPTTNKETVRVLTDALREWRFQPAATVEGEPIAVFYTLTVRVEVDGREA